MKAPLYRVAGVLLLTLVVIASLVATAQAAPGARPVATGGFSSAGPSTGVTADLTLGKLIAAVNVLGQRIAILESGARIVPATAQTPAVLKGAPAWLTTRTTLRPVDGVHLKILAGIVALGQRLATAEQVLGARVSPVPRPDYLRAPEWLRTRVAKTGDAVDEKMLAAVVALASRLNAAETLVSARLHAAR